MIGLADIQAASPVVQRFVRPTPHLFSYTLSALLEAPIFLKPESLQRTGSFKLRGACHRINALTREERHAGVIAASAGNHAQGVALAAQSFGIQATVVMPLSTPLNKIQRTAAAGAQVILKGDTVDESLDVAREEAARRSLILVHGYDDPWIIAGQGTVGLEIVQDLPEVGTIVVPVGGGGLIAGIALAVRSLRPQVRIIGVQAAGCPSAVRALEAGRPIAVPGPRTIADGIRVGRVGDLPFEIFRSRVDEIVLVEDEEISRALTFLMEKSKLVVEPAGATGVAALLAEKVRPLTGPVSVVLSGGNIDTNFFIRILERGLTQEGRLVLLRVAILDKPGQLARVLGLLADLGSNVLDVKHYRAGWQLPLEGTELEILLETRDPAHGREIVARLESEGYAVRLSGSAP